MQLVGVWFAGNPSEFLSRVPALNNSARKQQLTIGMMQKYGDLWRPENYPKKRKASNPAFENGNTGSVTFSDLEDRSNEKEGRCFKYNL